MHSKPFSPLADDTALAAEAILGTENLYIRIGKQADHLIQNCSAIAQSAADEGLDGHYCTLALATIIQFLEKMTDNQMEYASCNRLDIKYALHLPLHFPGIRQKRLCEFRKSIYTNPNWHLAFQQLIDQMSEANLIKGQGRERVVVDQFIPEICSLTRLEQMYSIVKMTIESIATNNPEWLRAVVLPHWFKRYIGCPNLQNFPEKPQEQKAFADFLGKDMQYLLSKAEGYPEINQLIEIQLLRAEWERRFSERSDRQPPRLSLGCEYCLVDQ